MGSSRETVSTRHLTYSQIPWGPSSDAVLFASYCGLSRSTPEGQLIPPNRVELDRRCTSIEGAVKFAKANNLLGILLDSNIIVSRWMCWAAAS